MDIYGVCEGLASAIRDNLVYQGGQRDPVVLPYCPDMVPDTPCIFVAEYEMDYDRTMNRGVDKLTVTIRALVSRSDDRAAAQNIAALFSGSGDSSLMVALNEGRGNPGQPTFPNTSWSGACDDYNVVRMQANRWYVHNEQNYLGGELTVNVIGSGG